MKSLRSKGLLLAALLALFGLGSTMPAQAGGSVTMLIRPNGEGAELIEQGLALYSLFDQRKGRKKKKNHARVDQKGHGNTAALKQRGVGNNGLVVQRGRQHTATLGQYGYHNALGVIQFGKRTNLDFAQIGNGQAGLIVQGGW